MSHRASLPEVMVLRPYEGFGPFDFGMTRAQVRQLLGDEPQNTSPSGLYSHRLHETIDTAEAYCAKGFNVQFNDDDGLVDWIVAFPYALPIIVGGITVPRSWRQAVKALNTGMKHSWTGRSRRPCPLRARMEGAPAHPIGRHRPAATPVLHGRHARRCPARQHHRPPGTMARQH